MRPVRLTALTQEQLDELDRLYRTTRDPRLPRQAQMGLLSAEKGVTAAVEVKKRRVKRGCSSNVINDAKMLWRHFRREVTHCELFESVEALLAAAKAFFDRCNAARDSVRSIIQAIAA